MALDPTHLKITQVHVLLQTAIQFAELVDGDAGLQLLTANRRRNEALDTELLSLLVGVRQVLWGRECGRLVEDGKGAKWSD